MANPTEIINALTASLSRYLWMQQFDIDEPANDLVDYNGIYYPSNTVFIAPASNVSIERFGAGQDIALQAMFTFSMSIQYRFNKTRWPAVNDVPFIQLTSLYHYIGVWLALTQRNDVTNIRLVPRSNPIQLGESENLSDQGGPYTKPLGDWLVTMWFDIEVTFNTDESDYSSDLWVDIQPPDFTPVDPPFTLTGLNIGIYRNQLTDPLNTELSELDHTIVIESDPD